MLFRSDNPAEIQAELTALSAKDDVGMDAIMFLVEPLTTLPDAFTAVAGFAYTHRLPFGGVYNSIDGYSSIFGVNVDLAESGRLAAPLADKVLKGTQAGTIPASTPENFIQINFKLAQELGLTVPEGLLKQANEIIR